MRTRLFIAFFSFALVISAQAHAPKMGKNGGRQVDAGQYHVEVVTNGNALAVYLHDHGEKPVSTKGFTGIAILVIKGKTERVVLTPEADNRMGGTASVELGTEIKGVVQITNDKKGTAQGRFE